MDEYGFGSAAAMGLQLFEHASRSSGRTLRMLDRATNDDMIVCRKAKEAERLRRLIKDRGKTTSVVVVEHCDELGNIQKRSKGRCIFDHDWTRQFFADVIKSAEEDLQRMADRFSSVPPDRKVEQAHVMNIQRRGQFEL